MTLTERLMANSEVSPTGCWLWIKHRDRDGYGRLTISEAGRKRNVAAHRAAYEEFVAPIPTGLQIDHVCRTRACINPDHLEPVTGRVNTLRSPIAPATLNSQVTTCPAGHAYTPSNTYRSKTGRSCLTCRRHRSRQWSRERATRGRGRLNL